MEAARRARGSLRTQFTKSLTTWNQIKDQLDQSSEEVHVTFTIINDYHTKIDSWNQKIFDLLLENNSPEADISSELEKVEVYKAEFIKVELEYARLKQQVPHAYSDSVSQSTVKHRLRVRLPKIEFYKFDGELANWLKFWSQFQKIHLDTDLTNEDKFQYLVQSMVPNTRASDLVNSFPPTNENYGKAIETLKNRFGKNELLVEVYIRELLQLVITNMAKSGQKFKVSVLYDKLESHLRALESLNITKEACAPILYPLVESSLPEELLRAWQRHASGLGAAPKDRLRQLLEFLQQEVDNEERISMAMRGFSLKDKPKPDVTKSSSRNTTPEDIPTASALFQAKNTSEVRCIFCDENHTNSKCMKAKKMTLIERQNIIKAKKGCIKCMRLGHFFKNCKCFVKCAWCGGRHALLMCQEASLSPKKQEDVKQSAANISINNNVYLQTLCVKLKNKEQSAVVRAIFDSGSQHSYILKDTASKLNYESCSEHTLQQGLFGGTTSKPQLHKKYIISVENLLTPFSCDIEVFDQDVICTDVTSVNDSNLITALKAKNIFVTDFKKGKQPISLLIGADMMAKLCTNNMYNLECGISAIETKLGWTLLGRNTNYCERNDDTLTVLILHINQSSISNLWKLDTLGILDPIERKTQEAHLQEVKENFESTTKLKEDGRYEVALPWKENHPPLTNNKDLAFKRLQKLTSKLRDESLYDTYGQIFKEWMAEDIIEKVPEQEYNNPNALYLPHRHVVRLSSSTTPVRPVFDASAHAKNSPSLNDCLETGPNLIELIPNILLRFREKGIGVISDIRKAFLQISLCPNDRDNLRFLWWDNNNANKLLIYRHCRVVFGLTCSPFL